MVRMHSSDSVLRKQGSVFVLVLAVLAGTLSLVAGIQSLQVRRTLDSRRVHTARTLRNALIQGLQIGMETLAEGTDTESSQWPLEGETSEGVQLRILVRDAQDRFNVNDLTLRPRENHPRTPWDQFQSLAAAEGIPFSSDLRARLEDALLDRDVQLESARELRTFFTDPEDFDRLESRLVAHPRPSERPATLNLQTVDPEVLRALVGEPLHAWADRVINLREQAPLQNIQATLTGLPLPLQRLLSSRLSLRSDYLEFTVVAEADYTLRTLDALVRRGSEGELEVLRCLW